MEHWMSHRNDFSCWQNEPVSAAHSIRELQEEDPLDTQFACNIVTSIIPNQEGGSKKKYGTVLNVKGVLHFKIARSNLKLKADPKKL